VRAQTSDLTIADIRQITAPSRIAADLPRQSECLLGVRVRPPTVTVDVCSRVFFRQIRLRADASEFH
jgi:hypothetical protein